MKNILRIEEAAMFVLAIYFAYHLPYAAWVFWALLLAPDLGMLGYLVNTKTGAITYNLLHHKGIAIVIFLLGVFIENTELQLTGTILFGHASMDRILGYGLKYADSFKHTHLGWLQ